MLWVAKSSAPHAVAAAASKVLMVSRVNAWATVTDDLDIPYLVQYALVEPAS